MKLQLISALAVGIWCGLLSATNAGGLSNRYLPPHASSRPSNQYLAPARTPHYHGVSGGGAVGGGHSSLTRGGSGHYASGSAASVSSGAQYGGGFGGGHGGHGGHGSRIGGGAQIPILRQDYTNDGNGNYKFGYETGNGIQQDETGTFAGGWPHGSLNVMGSYSYTGDDGRQYTVKYTADKDGFHPEGDHLPTPPPIPHEIAESLALHHGGHSAARSGGHGGHSSYGGSGFGGHAAAASARAPSTEYLPPHQGQSSRGQGYHYGRRFR